MESNFDLHIHSTKSDGTKTPTEIVNEAAQKGLAVISITDHDSVAGVEEGLARAKEVGIRCLSGIELSAFEEREIHILGYNVDIYNQAFLNKLDDLQALRKERNYEIVRKLRSHGVKIRVDNELEDGSKGRSLIANMLVEQGFVRTRAEAFDKYIGANAPCYVGKMRISPEDAVALIHSAGGLSVLAHPYRYLKEGNLDAFAARLAGYGLQGIEVYYPNYGRDVRLSLKQTAAKYALFCTGGSDHHSGTYGAAIGGVKVFLNAEAKSKLGI